MGLSSKSCGKALAGVALVAGVLAFTTESKAEALTHDGFYFQLDAGLGYLSTSAEAGGAKVKYSGLSFPSMSALFGGTVGPVVIGGGFFFDRVGSPSVSLNGQDLQGTSDITLTLIGIGAFADIYPDPHNGLHFQPFVGWGGLESSNNGNSGGSDPTGLMLAVGAGYDFFVSDNWSIGPMFRIAYAPLKLNDVTYSTVAPVLLCSFTYH
jgi:hypothetical protein